VKRLRHENVEFRRANAILKTASASSRPNSTGLNTNTVHRRSSGSPRRPRVEKGMIDKPVINGAIS
jgi:hypothetical protein